MTCTFTSHVAYVRKAFSLNSILNIAFLQAEQVLDECLFVIRINGR